MRWAWCSWPWAWPGRLALILDPVRSRIPDCAGHAALDRPVRLQDRAVFRPLRPSPPCGFRGRRRGGGAGALARHRQGGVAGAVHQHACLCADASVAAGWRQRARSSGILLLCWGALLGVGIGHHWATLETKLWCAVLFTQSLPYLAAVGVAILAAMPPRPPKRAPARLAGRAPPAATEDSKKKIAAQGRVAHLLLAVRREAGHKASVDRESATGDPPALAVNLLLGGGDASRAFLSPSIPKSRVDTGQYRFKPRFEAPETFVYDRPTHFRNAGLCGAHPAGPEEQRLHQPHADSGGRHSGRPVGPRRARHRPDRHRQDRRLCAADSAADGCQPAAPAPLRHPRADPLADPRTRGADRAGIQEIRHRPCAQHRADRRRRRAQSARSTACRAARTSWSARRAASAT